LAKSPPGEISGGQITEIQYLAKLRFHKETPLVPIILPPKCLPSRSPRYGVARTAMGSCISSNRSRPRSSSLANERSSTPLTPHRTWLSSATLACLPTRPLLLRLQAEQSLPAGRFPFVRLSSNPSSAESRMPSKALRHYRRPNSLISAVPQSIQNP
jgi:hypothetical protein